MRCLCVHCRVVVIEGVELHTHISKWHLVRQTGLLHGKGGANAGGLAHGDGVAGDAVAGMGGETAADAAAGQKQAVAVAGNQGAQGDV